MKTPAQPPSEEGFLSRWSRRKVGGPAEPAAPAMTPGRTMERTAPVAPVDPSPQAPPTAPDVEPAPEPAVPTLDDVARLTRDADFSAFVRPDVDPGVRNAALKKLFTDPHYNVMDGLDTYIDDYGRPDPLPASMLRKMAQSQFLGLFPEEAEPAATPDLTVSVTAAPALLQETAAPDEDPDLRLQPDDAAADSGAAPEPGEDAGRVG